MADNDDLDRDDQDEQGQGGNTGEEQEGNVGVDPKEYEKLRDDFTKTRKALEKANKEAQQRRQELKSYREVQEQYGLEDLDQLRELLDAQKKAEEHQANRDGDVDKIRKQLEAQHKKQLEEKENLIQQMTGSMQRHMIESEATRAISEHEGVPRLLMPHIKESVKFAQTDSGEWVVRVVDEDGDPRFTIDGEYMSISDLVGEMRESEDFGLAFKARNKGSGTGSDPNNKDKQGEGRKKNTNLKKSEMTQKEKGAFIKEHGYDEYEKLPM